MFYPKKTWNSSLGSKLKKQTSVSGKQYQGLDKFLKSDVKEEPIKNKKGKLTKTWKPKPMYDSKYSFSDFSNIKKYYAVSFASKYNKFLPLYYRLNEFRNLVLRKKKLKKTECIKMLQIYIIHC